MPSSLTIIRVNNLVGFDVKQASMIDNYINLILGVVYDVPDPTVEMKYETVVAGEFLEHVENPVLFLKRCRTVIKHGGRLVLSTPNPHNLFEFVFNITLNRKYMFAADHVTLYLQRYLIRIIELAGFKNVKLYSGGVSLPFAGRDVPFPWFGLVPFPRALCYQTIAIADHI